MFNIIHIMANLATTSVFLFLCLRTCLGISLNNGAYEDIYIVIQDSVSEEEVLITRLKEIFTVASAKLFAATSRQVYFGKIKIVIPHSWTPKPSYKTIPSLSPLASYIQVDNGASEVPRVYHGGGCGSPGRYMYLHTNFVRTSLTTDWGLHANVIVHEWGHLRWGLYDEYPTRGVRHFYQEDGVWKPVRCTREVQGSVVKTSDCPPTTKCNLTDTSRTLHSCCVFRPDSSQNVAASLMGTQYIDKLWAFCDADKNTTTSSRRHNSRTNTKQNVNCERKSAWEIMRKHSDFKANRQLGASTNTVPEFEILQDSVRYQVFVLDVSGSMAGTRISNMHATGQYIIDHVLKNSSWLGIVTFSSGSTTVKALTEIDGQSSRDTLKNSLPTSTGGSTCIGCGIDTAIGNTSLNVESGVPLVNPVGGVEAVHQLLVNRLSSFCTMTILRSHLGDPEGGTLFVLSDGGNNRGILDTSIQNAVNAKVTIHTVAISQAADSRLSAIAARTGGKHFSHLEVLSGSVSLAASFAAAASESATGVNSDPATLVSEIGRLDRNQSLTFSFIVEDGLGGDTTLVILPSVESSLRVIVTLPDGTTLTENDTTTYMSIDLSRPNLVGEYGVNITLTSGSAAIEYRVTSNPTSGHPLRVYSYLSESYYDFVKADGLPKFFADVVKGGAAVLNATVTANVESNSVSCSLALKDDGRDPDETLQDGTYTGFISKSCLDNRRLNIKVYARSDEGNTQLSSNVYSAATIYGTGHTDIIQTLQFGFQRVSLSETLTVTNYIASTNDTTPPNRITDVDLFKVTSSLTRSSESRNYSLTWTAPGDDYTSGQVSGYIIRVSEDIDLLANNFSLATELELPNSNFTPANSGEKERLTLVVVAENAFTKNAFVAVVGRDEAGNLGKVSNIVSMTVADGYRMTTAEYDPNANDDTDLDGDNDGTVSTVEYNSNSSREVTLIVTAGIVGLLLLTTVVVLTVCIVRSRQKKHEVKSKQRRVYERGPYYVYPQERIYVVPYEDWSEDAYY